MTGSKVVDYRFKKTVSGSSHYLPVRIPFIWFPIVYHYIFGIGQAKEYRGTIWHVYFYDGYSTWINRASLRILAV